MEKQCVNCLANFEVTEGDLAFYDKISPEFGGRRYDIPAPTKCPDCRWQQRLMFRNERTFYHRKCDLTGKVMISMHPQERLYPVYNIADWLSDKWDATDYGQDFDFARPYFEQFKELCNKVPHYSLFIDPSTDENSDYTNAAAFNKNCYLICQAAYNEDCFYSRGINNCTDCSDCFRVTDCELCYECVSTVGCHTCLWLRDSSNCNECYFSTELQGCRYCFGCHGLSNKEYYIFNKPVTKEEWEQKVGSLVLTPEVIEQMKQQSLEAKLKVPHKAAHLLNCEDVVGDDVINSSKCFEVYDSKDLEDCAYCHEVTQDAKDCHDLTMFGDSSELLYNCCASGVNAYNLLFSSHCWQGVSNLIYCESCFPAVKDCFGCFGLKRKQYCILNKQYTKEEYEELVPKIIEHMKTTGEWGEFFASEVSPYGYNETIANEYFPLSKNEADIQGYSWAEKPNLVDQDYMGPAPTIAEDIADVTDDITEAILMCSVTGKPYKVSKQELRLCKKLGVPIPTKCPDQRHLERIAMRNPRKLWQRECTQCSMAISTSYAPDRPETVYCEQCYLSEIYE